MNAIENSTKRCFKCETEKPRSEFYRHPRMSDGLLGKCKVCTKSDVTAHREANLEKVHAYDAARSKLPTRKSRRTVYQQESRKRGNKWRIREATRHAIASGKIQKRDTCEHCDAPATEVHHRDYETPFNIVFVCFKCHREVEHGQKVTSPFNGRNSATRDEAAQ